MSSEIVSLALVFFLWYFLRMPKTKRKDAGAVAMAKKRWRKTTKEQRSALMTAAINKRWENYRKAKEEKEIVAA